MQMTENSVNFIPLVNCIADMNRFCVVFWGWFVL